MQNLAAEGKYEITDEMKAQLKDFYGNYANEKETAEEIAEVYKKTGYIMDTHNRCCFQSIPQVMWQRPVIRPRP